MITPEPSDWLSCCWVSSGNMRRKNGSLPNGLTRTTCRVRTLTTAGVTFSSIGASEGSGWPATVVRSEEHTSELQSLMRISYAVFCLKKKNHNIVYQQTIIYRTMNRTH